MGRAHHRRLVFTDRDERARLELHTGLLTHRLLPAADDTADVVFTLGTPVLKQFITGMRTLPDLVRDGDLSASGAIDRFADLIALLDTPDQAFEIVLP